MTEENKEILPAPTILEEEYKILPEGLEFVRAYLETFNVKAASEALGIPVEEGMRLYKNREVKAFIDTVFLEQGYMNRDKLSDTMTLIIDKKLEEMKDEDATSGKDIADLLKQAHSMRMEELKMLVKLEEVRATKNAPKIAIQSNTYNNGEVSNYNSLLERIVSGK